MKMLTLLLLSFGLIGCSGCAYNQENFENEAALVKTQLQDEYTAHATITNTLNSLLDAGLIKPDVYKTTAQNVMTCKATLDSAKEDIDAGNLPAARNKLKLTSRLLAQVNVTLLTLQEKQNEQGTTGASNGATSGTDSGSSSPVDSTGSTSWRHYRGRGHRSLGTSEVTIRLSRCGNEKALRSVGLIAA